MVETVPAPPEILSLTLAQLVPSPTNPRTFFDEARLDELAASMQTVGVLQPLVVRPAKPSPHLTGGSLYEIVAGERRFRAAKRAKLDAVPVVVRHLSDLQVLETQLIENAQRDDIHAIDNAEAFARLQKLDGSYNAKVIAAKIGKSERYVQNVLHYAVLVSTVKEAFRANQINAGHADLIARLKPADQERALKACFHNLYGEDKERGSISVRQLDGWIKDNIRLDIEVKNPELAGLPELRKAIATPEAAKSLLQVHGEYGDDVKGAIPPEDYKLVKGRSDRCAETEHAVMVLGDRRGELVDICRAKATCKKHWKWEIEGQTRDAKPGAKRKLTKWELQAQAKMKRGRRWGKIRKLAFAAVKDKAKGVTLAQALPVLNYGINRWHATSAKATLEKLVIAAVENDIHFIQQDTFTRHIAGPLKIDIKALEQQAFPKPTKSAKARGLVRGRKAPKKRKAGKKR